ncbi:hypothetical protein KR222_006848 [Zaprionus bogoriensis]|nr:hypothetical protein KR222_006848 [Zaprionus bogoriensis]
MAAAPQDALQAAYVDFSEIKLREKVGHGSYGVVCKAIWRDQLVAVKEFFASAEKKDIEKEVKQLSRVKHPNIIALHGISSYQQATYLIMEYAEGGSLHNFLHGKVKPAYSLAHAMSWALQCAEGVAYLHGMSPKPLIHRDLKPLNLLLTNKGRNLKICDFGTVADKSTMMTNNRGSAAWMAPEVFEGSKYTEKCDIFSWAIVLWEVLSRKQPFRDIDNAYTIQWKIYKGECAAHTHIYINLYIYIFIYIYIPLGERPPLLDNCPRRIEQLMTACWKTAPEERPSMQYIVGIMNEIIKDYVGADKALEYEFVNQQIVTKESDGTVAAQYESLSHSTSDMSLASTQLTPTNVHGTATEFGTGRATGTGTGAGTGASTGSGFSNTENTSFEKTPTNSGQLVDNNGLFHMSSSNRWGAIPEEDSGESQINDSFNLKSSAEASKLYARCYWIFPLIHLWFFRFFFCETAKSDGRERLTVTDTKPVIMASNNTTTDLTNNNNNNSNNNNNNIAINNSNNNENNTNGLLGHAPNANSECAVEAVGDDVDAEEDVDAGCGFTDQSLAEILDPELQPEPPIPNNAESQAIYRAHRHMAKAYLSVDTNIYYAQDFKDKLVLQMDRTEREQKMELLRKIKDKEGLQELYNTLQQQRDKLPGAPQMNNHARLQPPVGQEVGSGGGGVGAGDGVDNDGWVVIAPHHNA